MKYKNGIKSYYNNQEGVILTLNQRDEINKDGKKIILLPAHVWLKNLSNTVL